MADATDRVMRHGAAQVFLRDIFMSHGADYIRTGYEHVAGLRDHEDKIGDRRRVDRAARARTHNGGDLRNHAAGQGVAQEDIRVPAE